MDVNSYRENCYEVSELITRQYSTSFSMAISLLEKEIQKAVYAIYGFVRVADEIVDSFHGYDKIFLLDNLREQLEYALQNGISTNPVLVSFADTVHRYQISREHIDAFLESMNHDLVKASYTNKSELDRYIYGSADVVGLMCLKVFCNGSQTEYDQLEYPAQKLGSAFQKVNFMRDLNSDKNELGRSYFPEISNGPFNERSKKLIEQSIDKDFADAWIGVRQLSGRVKLAVALAYFYYKALLGKIRKTTPEHILSERLRISNLRKYLILVRVGILYKTKLI
jgi:phytoene/squalene synthetase